MISFVVFASLLLHVAHAVLGVDVSVSISPSVASCLVSSGYTFVIVHATLCGSGTVDTTSAASIANLRAANMPHVGVYMYCCWGRSNCPSGSSVMSAHSSYFSSHGVDPDSVWLDVENTGTGGVCPQAGLSATQSSVADITQAAVATFGTRVGMYTSKNYWQTMVGTSFNADSSVSLPLWYAHYDNVAAFSDFSSFGPWSQPYAKQYAGDTTVCGVDVDVNYAPEWQAGSWATNAPPVPAPPAPTPPGGCTYQGAVGMCVSSCPGGQLYPSSAGANGCQNDLAAIQCCITGGGGDSTPAPTDNGGPSSSTATDMTSDNSPTSDTGAAPTQAGVMPCTVVGAPTGTCAASCGGGVLVAHGQATGCEAFDSTIQCCVQFPCSYGGSTGACTDTCGGTSFTATQGATGCNKFANEVHCCIGGGGQTSNYPSNSASSVAPITGGPACTYTTHSGACIATADCAQQSGTSFAAATGAQGCMKLGKDIQCCIATGSLLTSEIAIAKMASSPAGVPIGAIVGIVIGVLLALALVLGVAYYLVFQRKRPRTAKRGEITYSNASYGAPAPAPSGEASFL